MLAYITCAGVLPQSLHLLLLAIPNLQCWTRHKLFTLLRHLVGSCVMPTYCMHRANQQGCPYACTNLQDYLLSLPDKTAFAGTLSPFCGQLMNSELKIALCVQAAKLGKPDYGLL